MANAKPKQPANVAKLDYYDYGQLLSYNATYNTVVGGRGLGKTFGIKVKSVDAFFKKREEFFLLRRYKDEVAKTAPMFFEDIAYQYPFADFRVQGGKAETASAETRGQKKRQWDTVGHFGALSVGHQFKGVPMPNVTRLIYDEFIIEKGNSQYLKDEVVKFNNFYSTIDRWNDRCKAYLLANSVSMNNPFFIEWRIRPDEGKEFQTAFNGFVVVHLPDVESFKSQVYATRFGQFIKASSPEYGEYAVGNQFADAHDALIDGKPSTATYRFSVDTASGQFSVWYDPAFGRYYVQRKLPKAEKVFTLDRGRVSPERTFINQSSPLLGMLRTAFNHARMWFDEPSTRNSFIEIFKR